AKALWPRLGEGTRQCRRKSLQCRTQPPQRNPDLMDEFRSLVRFNVRRADDIALPLADARLGQCDECFLDRLPAANRRGFRSDRLRAGCCGALHASVLVQLVDLIRTTGG